MFGGKITNNIYQIIYWYPKPLFERKRLQKFRKNVCCRTLSQSLIFWTDFNWQVRENGNKFKDNDKYLIWQKKEYRRKNTVAASIVIYTEGKLAFKSDLEAKSTKKGTATAVRRFRCWFEGKHHKEIERHKITKKRSPPTVKTFHFKNLRDK